MKKNDHMFIGGVTLVVISISIYNIYTYNDFFKMSMHNVATVFIALIFAYFLNQKNNKIQKSKEKTEQFLSKYQAIIADPRFRKVTSVDDIEFLMLKHRRLNNLITVLEKMQMNIDLTHLKEKANSHKELVGNHYNDIDYLIKSSTELSSFIDLMDYHIDNCIVTLFK